MLAGKSHEEIMTFFSRFDHGSQPNETPQPPLADARAADLVRWAPDRHGIARGSAGLLFRRRAEESGTVATGFTSRPTPFR